jgi:shikimate dehydrogenase
VTAGPERLVLLGHPLGHSLSPAIQNAALRAAGIALVYEPLDVPKSALEATIEELRRTRAAGNVTIPYKEAMLAACDRATAEARAAGAVNTFWVAVDGALVGDNTDVEGFAAAAKQLVGESRVGERVALLGAGGGAAAVLRAIVGWREVSVRVYSRTRDRAERLLKRVGIEGVVCSSAEVAVKSSTLLVNATPVGLRNGELPVAVTALPERCAVLDLAYTANETSLVREARGRGHPAMDGTTMLVEQGAAAFERWFGERADRDAMWDAIRSVR